MARSRTPRTVDDLLAQARATLPHRPSPGEALTAQVSGQAVQLTIDATNLRYADSASVTTLAMAAMEVRTRNGSVTLLNPQPAVARILDVLRAGEMFCIRRRAARDPAGHQRGR